MSSPREALARARRLAAAPRYEDRALGGAAWREALGADVHAAAVLVACARHAPPFGIDRAEQALGLTPLPTAPSEDEHPPSTDELRALWATVYPPTPWDGAVDVWRELALAWTLAHEERRAWRAAALERHRARCDRRTCERAGCGRLPLGADARGRASDLDRALPRAIAGSVGGLVSVACAPLTGRQEALLRGERRDDLLRWCAADPWVGYAAGISAGDRYGAAAWMALTGWAPDVVRWALGP